MVTTVFGGFGNVVRNIQVRAYGNDLAGPATPIGAVPLDSATLAWIAAVQGDGGTVSPARQTLVNNVVTSAKSYGVFSKIDRLWLFAAENTQSALRDIIATGLATAVSGGSGPPTFSANHGYTGVTNSRIRTDFNPTTAPSPNFVQNSAMVGVRSNTDSIHSNDMMVGYESVGSSITPLFILPRDSGTTSYFDVNSATSNFSFSTSTASAKGFFAIDRSASNSQTAYQDGSSLASNSNTSGAPLNSNIFFGCNQYGASAFFATNREYSIGIIAGHLTATEHSNLFNNVLLPYLTALGL